MIAFSLFYLCRYIYSCHWSGQNSYLQRIQGQKKKFFWYALVNISRLNKHWTLINYAAFIWKGSIIFFSRFSVVCEVCSEELFLIAPWVSCLIRNKDTKKTKALQCTCPCQSTSEIFSKTLRIFSFRWKHTAGNAEVLGPIPQSHS